MLPIQKLYQVLIATSRRYEALKSKFQDFANFVASELQADSSQVSDRVAQGEQSQVRGISVYLHLNNNYFDVAFAGRTLRFAFSSQIDSGSTLSGVVKCLVVDTQNEQNEQIGSFTFNDRGKTDLVHTPEDGLPDEPLYISDNSAYIVLHFLYDSLSKETL